MREEETVEGVGEREGGKVRKTGKKMREVIRQSFNVIYSCPDLPETPLLLFHSVNAHAPTHLL